MRIVAQLCLYCVTVWSENKTRSVRIMQHSGAFANHCCCGKAVLHAPSALCARRCTGAGVRMRACSLNYPAFNAPPYCHLRPLWLHHIFRHYLITDTILGKRLLNIKYVFWFSLEVLFEKFLVLRRIQRDIVMNVRTSCKVSVILNGF